MSASLETLALSIKRLQYCNYRALDARLAPLGISLVQWGALRQIERHPGLCMHGLAELTFNSDQAFGTLMTRLLRLKLVERQPGVGRANVHSLTPRGKALLGQGRKCLRHVMARAFAPLNTAECARLQELLAKLVGEWDVAAAPRPSLATRQPPTPFLRTTVGLVPEPGRPIIRPAGRPAKKRAGRVPLARGRKVRSAGGGAD